MSWQSASAWVSYSLKRHCGARYGCVLAGTGGEDGGGGDDGEDGPASPALVDAGDSGAEGSALLEDVAC